MWNSYNGWGWWGMGTAHGFVLWIFLIAGVVTVGVWLANPTRRREQDAPPPSALDILKMRYAKGEIGREEFEMKRRDLQA